MSEMIEAVAEAICTFRNAGVPPSLRSEPADWVPIARVAVETMDRGEASLDRGTWWFLEAHDGSWAENIERELFTRDPNKALRYPNRQRAWDAYHTAHHDMRFKLLSSGPTEHTFVAREHSSPLQVEGDKSRDELEALLSEAKAREGRLREALERWVRARKFILTLNDQIGSAEFKIAWNELGEAEWALAALNPEVKP